MTNHNWRTMYHARRFRGAEVDYLCDVDNGPYQWTQRYLMRVEWPTKAEALAACCNCIDEHDVVRIHDDNGRPV